MPASQPRKALAALWLAPILAAALVLMPALDVRAASPITFGFADGGGLVLGNPCTNGIAAVSQPIRVVWKSASGHLKARLDTTTTLGGSWQLCSDTKPLRVGDTIKATVQGTSRTLTMIDVSVASDRHSEFHGRGPASHSGTVWYSAGIFADYQESALVTTDADGRWSVEIADGLTGGLFAEVDWDRTAQGDYYTAYMYTPYVKVTLNDAAVEVGSSLGKATVKLTDPSTEALRAKAMVTLDQWGVAAGEFTDKLGNRVPVRAGDRIVSTLAPDLDWLVPNVTGTAKVAKDLVSGVCQATDIAATDALVKVFRSGRLLGTDLTRAELDGTFTAHFTGREVPFHRPANIKHGDTIAIDCYYATGDIVASTFVVP